jgi:hypothetical protein
MARKIQRTLGCCMGVWIESNDRQSSQWWSMFIVWCEHPFNFKKRPKMA